MVAGSVGGICLWTAIFPADVIKSRVQINNVKTNMFVMGAQIARTEGIAALYNGLKPTILRTIPATAVLFAVYEYSKKFMSSMFLNWLQIVHNIFCIVILVEFLLKEPFKGKTKKNWPAFAFSIFVQHFLKLCPVLALMWVNSAMRSKYRARTPFVSVALLTRDKKHTTICRVAHFCSYLAVIR